MFLLMGRIMHQLLNWFSSAIHQDLAGC
uniref:Uncharacterized protein n=1 Tax=Arundo donax TaxID=35708 RepID=A0A0A9BM97_ARUDO